MGILVLAVAILALYVPKACMWIDMSWINYLLMLVMFGMGLTLNINDFVMVFKRPKDILIGCAAQFTIMPLLAFALGKCFGLEAGMLAGVILVGTCPGGTASNVITFLSKGDVALSVGMTSVNTILAPVLTPTITWLLLRESVKVDVGGMFWSMVQVVVIPIALGFVFNKLFGDKLKQVVSCLPIVSVVAITLILASIVSHNSDLIKKTGIVVFAVVILHNLLGFGAGFLVGKLLGLPVAQKKALAIEVGMQNSGLASSLAKTAFSSLPMATVPGALFSVWHNISGAILASFFSRIEDEQKKVAK